jgi:GNAT superfamily N-acetyltransferase
MSSPQEPSDAGPVIDSRPLRHRDLFRAAGICARTFGDDAYWGAVGVWPRALLQPLIALDAFLALRAGQRNGASVIAARSRPAGELVGFAYFERYANPPSHPHPGVLDRLMGGGFKERRSQIASITNNHLPDGPVVYLKLVAVDRSRHGGGVGRLLLSEVFKAAEDTGVATMLDTSAHNLGFYEHLGFSVHAEMQWPLNQKAWMMVRPSRAQQ